MCRVAITSNGVQYRVMESLLGKLLIASPKLVDPNFRHAVVLMVQHDEQGAMGLILNRPTQTTAREMWAQVQQEGECKTRERLRHGGPCPGPLMLLHTHEHAAQSQILEETDQTPGVFFSTEKQDVEWLIQNAEDDLRVFIGYAGWAPGQLEGELHENAWLTAPVTMEQIFSGQADDWHTLTRTIHQAKYNLRIVPDDPSDN